MARPNSRVLLFGLVLLLAAVLATSPLSTRAQPAEQWIHDDRLWIYLEFDGIPITDATADNPIQINLHANMSLVLKLNVTGSRDLNASGRIWFYYQGIAIFPIEVRAPGSNSSWVTLPRDYETQVEAPIPLGDYLSFEDISLATGIFEASLNFTYREYGQTPYYYLGAIFYLIVPTDPLAVITSVAGIATTVATAAAVYGLGSGFNVLRDGIQTAHKVRSIQKKASEIRSLPNLTVLGALPLLFSIIDTMNLSKKKRKKDSEEAESPEGVSEYIVRQRIREVAPDAWRQDVCPTCRRKWDKSLGRCKKCGIDTEEAKRRYVELLVDRVTPALKVLGKKKNLSIRRIAKKTKSNNYNAGVIGAAMVDTNVSEITKIETPIRSLAMNIAGLCFLIVTWQQLLGGAASQWQTTLTIVSAGLSLGVIVALYFARKNQIQKLRTAIEAGKPVMPTETERTKEAGRPPEQKSEENGEGLPNEPQDGTDETEA